MKRIFTLIVALTLCTLSFAQTQTENDPMYRTLPKVQKSVTEQGSINEAGEHLIIAANSYNYAKLSPFILGLAGGILVASDQPEIGYGVSGLGLLLGVYFGFKGDSQLRKAGRKLQLYSGNKGLGMSLNLK